MRSHVRVLMFGLLSLVLGVSSKAARADDEVRPAAPPPPVSAVTPEGTYVAPLSQTTQQTYVPQSVAMSGPPILMDWNEGDPVPPGYHAGTRVRKGLIIAGSIVFGTLYLFSALGASLSADANQGQSNPGAALYIPGVGPFIQMSTTTTATGNFFNAVDGAAQCAGLAMLIYGLANPRTVLVRNDLAKPVVVPMHLGQNGYGMGLAMRF